MEFLFKALQYSMCGLSATLSAVHKLTNYQHKQYLALCETDQFSNQMLIHLLILRCTIYALNLGIPCTQATWKHKY